MNLQQLRYVREVAANGMSISRAAKTLHTSQPGVSQQIRCLERELKIDLFVREKNRIMDLTTHGHQLIGRVGAALAEVDAMAQYAKSVARDAAGKLVVLAARTHTRYLLPPVLDAYAKKQPGVQVEVRHGNAGEVLAQLASRVQAIGIVFAAVSPHKEVLVLPYASYPRRVVVPKGHPLLKKRQPSVRQVAEYPLITYETSVGGRQVVLDRFRESGAMPEVVLSGIDADVIKACVEQGLGIAVLPEVAYDPRRDAKLSLLKQTDLFPPVIASIAIHRNYELRPHELDFIRLLAPRLDDKAFDALRARQPA